MLNEIYNKRIIELAGNIPRLGRLPDPDASATAHSKLCGSTVKIDLKMDGPTVTDFAHDVKACALGQASSSIMARHVVGSTLLTAVPLALNLVALATASAAGVSSVLGLALVLTAVNAALGAGRFLVLRRLFS